MAREEIELKFAVREPEALRRRLRARGFRVAVRRRLERNWIFDDAGSSLRRGDRLLRLRESGRRWLLTAKGPRAAGVLKRRREAELEVDDAGAWRALLAGVGLRARLSYVRYRTVLRTGGGGGELAWDETPMGVYLEIEGSAAWVRRTARQLGLRPEAAEPRSYPELYGARRRRGA